MIPNSPLFFSDSVSTLTSGVRTEEKKMNDEQKAKFRKIVEDGFGYPFHDNQSQELTRLNRHVKKQMNGVMDEFIEVMCGNCEYSCNESNCEKRHNE